MQDQLQKAINLAKKTGDRIIVFDCTKATDAYVIMCLHDYENLVLGKSQVRGLTEEQLLDRINRDIAIWKSEQDFDEIYNSEKLDLIDRFSGFDKQDKSGYFYDNKEDVMRKKPGFSRSWSIPRDRKNYAEEVVEDEEESRQYLEEVPF